MIETAALAYAHTGAPAIAFPDVSLPQGATLLLTGRSGSGKSTWLSLVSGLLTPAAGSLVVAGQALSGGAHGQGTMHGAARDAWRAATIGLLPQRLFLSEALTVQQNLELPFLPVAGRWMRGPCSRRSRYWSCSHCTNANPRSCRADRRSA